MEEEVLSMADKVSEGWTRRARLSAHCHEGGQLDRDSPPSWVDDRP